MLSADLAVELGVSKDTVLNCLYAMGKKNGARCIRLTFSEKQAGIVDDSRPYLSWESGSYIHVRYLEEKKCFSIGSDRACDVSVPTPHLTATHATIVRNIFRGIIQFSVKPAFSRQS
ncbi:hypothetical protein GCK32_005904 [Trichostrongylus colubriformis]|uniref:Uncharacterized protein n=1 Tax=Trichostrongylus colubriformis TaxID=6319 RepID=A0AAN8G250_TRICO